MRWVIEICAHAQHTHAHAHTLCEVGTGVSVSQSLRPNAQGNGLLHQAGGRLLVGRGSDRARCQSEQWCQGLGS